MTDKQKEELETELHKLNWIEILRDAIESRRTSWGEHPVIEWRNASDELLFSLLRQLRKKGIIPEQGWWLKNEL